MKSTLKKIILFVLFPVLSFAQTETFNLYHPEADAKAEVNAAVKKAAAEHKHVLLMIGGNWCKWCRIFDKFQHSNYAVDSALNNNFVFQHVNYSKENKNSELLTELEFPQRFGFPVFVVLNEKGQRIHTQNSAYLEKGEGYEVEKVVEFLDQWRYGALKAENYK